MIRLLSVFVIFNHFSTSLILNSYLTCRSLDVNLHCVLNKFVKNILLNLLFNTCGGKCPFKGNGNCRERERERGRHGTRVSVGEQEETVKPSNKREIGQDGSRSTRRPAHMAGSGLGLWQVCTRRHMGRRGS